MAAPWQPGDAVGEPSAELAGVFIEREELRLDLRGLTDGSIATVEATYHLRNDGADRTIELVFVAPDLDGSAPGSTQVTVDGVSVEHEVGRGDELPWQPPTTTPGIDGRRVTYLTEVRGQLEFSAPIPAGRHELSVRYPVRPGINSTAGPTRLWQVGYVLSPARQWPGFGTLDVVVDLPPGWSAASEPPLERRGDTLVGSFAGVPADTLGVTAQAPAPPIGLLQLLVFVGVIGLGFVIAWWAGKALRLKGRGARWLLPVSVLYGFIAPVVITVAAFFISDMVPAGQRATGYDPGPFLAFLSAPLVLIVVIVGMQVVAVVAGSTAVPATWRPTGPPPPPPPSSTGPAG